MRRATTGGSYLFLRDVEDGTVWSAGFQPSGAQPDIYDVNFKEDRAEFIRRDGSLTTVLEVLVSAEDSAEVRRVSVTNSGNRTREIDITSYAELVLGPQAADVAHPAFSKLFLETEYLAEAGIILATRRRRAPSEPEIWAAHLAVIDGEAVGRPQIETDRARFLGRGCGIRTPIAMIDGRPLSNTVGTVLDPIFAMRRRVRVAPGATVRVAFWTVVADSRTAVLDLTDKHRDVTAFERAATLAWTQASVQLHHLGITPGDASLFQRLGGHLLYAAPALRPSSDTIRQGGGGQSGLWAHGISGDLPIILLRIADTENLDIARQVLQGARILAHETIRRRCRDLERTRVFLRAGSANRARDLACVPASRDLQVRAAQARIDGPSGRVFILSRRSDFGRGPRAFVVGVAGGAGRSARASFGSTRSCAESQGDASLSFKTRPCGLTRAHGAATTGTRIF